MALVRLLLALNTERASSFIAAIGRRSGAGGLNLAELRSQADVSDELGGGYN
jgi:hypothetical protein